MIKSQFSARVYGWSLLLIPFIIVGLYWVSRPGKIILRSLYFGRALVRTDIRQIDLGSSEDLTITLGNGQAYSLKYGVYRNMPKLKRYLRDNYAGLAVVDAPGGNTDVVPAHRVSHAEKRVFAGNFFTSQNGIFVMGFSAVFLWGLMRIRHQVLLHPWYFLIFLPPYIFFYFAIGRQLYYFRLDGEQIEVVNYIFPGYKKVYRLQDIARATFEPGASGSCSLGIRTKDFEYGSYGAGTLREKDWQKLHTALKTRKVPVSAGSR